MAVSARRARSLALALENVSSGPHFDRIAFRTPRRTFCTLALSGVDINFMFDLEQQQKFCELAPHAIAPVPGGWGRMGATRCALEAIDLPTFKQALKAAHARANAPLAKRTAQQSVRKSKPTAQQSARKSKPTAQQSVRKSKPTAQQSVRRSKPGVER
jgi:hypothetical protein